MAAARTKARPRIEPKSKKAGSTRLTAKTKSRSAGLAPDASAFCLCSLINSAALLPFADGGLGVGRFEQVVAQQLDQALVAAGHDFAVGHGGPPEYRQRRELPGLARAQRRAVTRLARVDFVGG